MRSSVEEDAAGGADQEGKGRAMTAVTKLYYKAGIVSPPGWPRGEAKELSSPLPFARLEPRRCRAFLQTIEDYTLQHVYIPANFCYPRGWFVKQLLARPERQKALIDAFTGLRNSLVCPRTQRLCGATSPSLASAYHLSIEATSQ
ncbi:hypothetical protein FALBO_7828 [Fusarium albosuccineum]|uniref:Uncharacterized protein n=1 Tax=Fusarium albosuccineum TaxID=1237068 RepID=A0A8H4LC31_9HYPO|nr:hypothetical protein FALBO_7828 [Fusarium albosuccineum]